MKRIVLAMACIAGINLAQASEVYLEGITLLGKNRSAHLSVDGAKVTVHIGDKVAEYTVYKIEPRLVSLQTPDGAIVEMALQTRLSEVLPKPEAQPAPPPDQPEANKPAQTFTPRRIEDSDIPPGKRRVRTPFGDVLVDEQQPTK